MLVGNGRKTQQSLKITDDSNRQGTRNRDHHLALVALRQLPNFINSAIQPFQFNRYFLQIIARTNKKNPATLF